MHAISEEKLPDWLIEEIDRKGAYTVEYPVHIEFKKIPKKEDVIGEKKWKYIMK